MFGTRGIRPLAISVFAALLAAPPLLSPAAAGAASPRAHFVTVSSPAGFGIDGSRLVYAAKAGADYDIFLRDLSKSRTTRLTWGKGDQTQPAISGSTVVWADYRKGSADIWAYDLTTRVARQVTFSVPDQTHPAISGDWLVFEDYGNGYYPRIGAMNLVSGASGVLGSGYGVRKTRPRISGGLVVWEDSSSGYRAVAGADLTGQGRSILTTAPTAEIQPFTDGRTVVYAAVRPDGRVDIEAHDSLTHTTRPVTSASGDEMRGVLVNGKVFWLSRPTAGDEARLAWESSYRAPRPVYVDGRPVDRAGSIVELQSGGGSLAFLQRYRNSWRIGAWTPPAPATSAQPSGLAAVKGVVRALVSLVNALADTSAPGYVSYIYPPRVKGLSSVTVSWTPTTDTESPPVSYDLYRYKLPITSDNLSSATKVASGVTASGVTTKAAADEASASYTYHYAVVAKDAVGNAAQPSYSLAPNPHGTSTISYHCYRCHPGAPHGGGGATWGALGAKTRYACYACHGGTSSTTGYGAASTLDAQGDSRDYADQSSTVGSRHRNSYLESTQSECDACHTPHRTPYYVDPATGLYDPAKSYSSLLRVVEATDPAKYLYSSDSTPAGNTFCLDCHGASSLPLDIVGGPTAYVGSGGDHNAAGNAGTAHGPGVLKPGDTNPGIQCRVCHDQHAAAGDKLLDYRGSETTSSTAYFQANLCFKCHSKSSTENTVQAGYHAPFAWNDRDVRDQFTTSTLVSKHPVTTSATGRSATCVNCHNVHLVSEAGTRAGEASRVADPRDTQHFPASLSAFCTGCHQADPPQAEISDTKLVPYRVGFTPTSTPSYFTGWDKSAFLAGGHVSGATRTPCSTCHDPHASKSRRLLAWTRPSAWTTGYPGVRNNTDTTLVREEALCFQCHGNNGSLGRTAPGAPNIATMTALPYSHQPTATSGTHSDTESASAFDPSGGSRHAECVDCHDPHSARKVNGSASQDSTNSSVVGGACYGIAGAQPHWGAFWTTPASFVPRLLEGGAGDLEAYLCFKCHSSAAGTIPSGQTDLAKEFNPNNASFHNVLGQSVGMRSSFSVKASDGTTYNVTWAVPTVAFLTNGMTPNSMLTCTSCHTNQTAGKAKGPHGSSVAWLLDPAYPTDWKTAGLIGTGNGISVNGTAESLAVICAKCHDIYPSSNGAHGQSAHYRSDGYTCTYCHVAIPHGWKRPRLLGYNDDGAYATASLGMRRIKADDNHTLSKGVAGWGSSSCETGGCKNHATASPYWP